MSFTIRSYEPTDETSWLRCRALSFLSTCYYDDVWTQRPASPAVQLVARCGDTVVGILDVEIEDDLATIDTVAVHPDNQGEGIAAALLTHARRELPSTVTTVDAWTREDEPALGSYHAQGFVEWSTTSTSTRPARTRTIGRTSPDRLSAPLAAFCHARLEDESDLRARFSRVYVCRRFSRSVPSE